MTSGHFIKQNNVPHNDIYLHNPSIMHYKQIYGSKGFFQPNQLLCNLNTKNVMDPPIHQGLLLEYKLFWVWQAASIARDAIKSHNLSQIWSH
jgi:hypothetical protein